MWLTRELTPEKTIAVFATEFVYGHHLKRHLKSVTKKSDLEEARRGVEGQDVKNAVPGPKGDEKSPFPFSKTWKPKTEAGRLAFEEREKKIAQLPVEPFKYQDAVHAITAIFESTTLQNSAAEVPVPGPETGPESGPKPSPKPSPNPVPKPSQKPGSKPGPETVPKPAAVSGSKPVTTSTTQTTHTPHIDTTSAKGGVGVGTGTGTEKITGMITGAKRKRTVEAVASPNAKKPKISVEGNHEEDPKPPNPPVRPALRRSSRRLTQP
jgi:hypothetical protein